jgi:exonuclease 3'-5' domain-containing protein 1
MTIFIREHKPERDDNWQRQYHIMESVYVLDITTLEVSTFNTVVPEREKRELVCIPGPITTFKEVLESPDTPKIFFDVRNDADALFAHFGIHLRGTLDLQLLENFKPLLS